MFNQYPEVFDQNEILQAALKELCGEDGSALGKVNQRARTPWMNASMQIKKAKKNLPRDMVPLEWISNGKGQIREKQT